jgi:hypothetical protein
VLPAALAYEVISVVSLSCIVTCRMSCRREALFESYVDMLHHHCSETPGTYSVLREVLQRAIKEFPNNMYLLTMVAKLEVSIVLLIYICNK